MNKIKCVFFVMCATLICSFATAQVNDSIPVKTGIFSKLNFSKIQLPKFKFLKKDSSIVKTDELKVKNTDSPKVEKVKDTAKKVSFLTKLKFNNKAELKTDSAIVVAPVVEKVKDTAKKVSFLTKLKFNKKAETKIDSAIVVAPVVEKVKDTAKKLSFLTKLKFNKKAESKIDSAIVVAPKVEKVKDTAKKVSFLTKLKLNKKAESKIDSAIVVAPVVEKVKDTAKKLSFLTKLKLNKKAESKIDSAIVVAPVVEKVKDTAKKLSFLTKLKLNKKAESKIDSAIVVAPVVEKVKDTAKKLSFLTKLKFNKKAELKTDSAIVVAPLVEKVKDTAKKVSFLTKLKFNKKAESKTDNSNVVAPVVEKVKDTISVYKSIKEQFLKYTATTTVSLLSGANFSKQIVDVGDFNSNFNYIYSDINNDVYKTGYFGGIRLDGMFKQKHEYSLSVSIGKLSSGASYINSSSLGPVVGSFSTFKAEDHFFTMNVAAHYKKLIPYGDLDKFKFYVVGGPSIDARLSNTSLDNKVTNAYKQMFIKGTLGLEFNNRSLYTLFLHYQHNIGSLTKAPIKTNINTFQIGIMVKATDLL